MIEKGWQYLENNNVHARKELSVVLECMHVAGQSGVNLVPPIPLPSTNHLMLWKTGSKKRIITRVMFGYTSNIFPKNKGCG